MPYDPVEVFAANARQRRLESGVSQERLAEIAGMDRTYIGAIERGERNLTLRSAQKIAQALQFPLWRMLEPDE